MHRTLKEAATQPPKQNLKQQQTRFNEFIEEYNHERPHEALNNHCPGEVYKASFRPLPSQLPEMSYPGHYEVRLVRSNGEIKWNGRKYFISELLYGEPIGVDLLSEDKIAIYYSKLRIKVIDLNLDRQER